MQELTFLLRNFIPAAGKRDRDVWYSCRAFDSRLGRCGAYYSRPTLCRRYACTPTGVWSAFVKENFSDRLQWGKEVMSNRRERRAPAKWGT
jgi:Fe-S-cluster containining protein